MTLRYLLVNHVPLGRGSAPHRHLVGSMWLTDLRAQRDALAAEGMRLLLATPFLDPLPAGSSGSFDEVEIDPADEGIEYVPLPPYLNLREYLARRGEVAHRLAGALDGADVAQLDYGGHPIPLGQLGWPLAARAGVPRVWVFDGADPLPRLLLHARSEPRPLARWLKLRLARRCDAFFARAVAEADLVFAHNASSRERYRDGWDERCHLFERSFVTDDLLLDDAALEARAGRLRRERPLRLLAAGRQVAIKGTDQVLAAMARAIEAGADLTLEVLGEGADRPAFEALARRLGLGGRVRFAGSVPYGPELFARWDAGHVLVITNLTAEISRNVLLGMARGLPLVTYSNPGTDRLVASGGAAEIVPVGDVDALARALLAADRDREPLAARARAGLQLARAHTLSATHRARARLVRRMLEGVARPAPAR